MDILHFSTEDINGGAAKASYRLHQALCKASCNSKVAVRLKIYGDPDVYLLPPEFKLQPIIYKFKNKFDILTGRKPRAAYMFNRNEPACINNQHLFEFPKPDIINLHWTTGLLTTNLIKQLYCHYKIPIVWTLMDQEPVTGGCHYSFGCQRYTEKCGNCPLLTPSSSEDISRITWENKKSDLGGLPITFISPTSQVKKWIQSSSLFGNFPLQDISLAIDTDTFKPYDKQLAKEHFHISPDKKVLFFGAGLLTDMRKGMSYLIESLNKLASMISKNNKLQTNDIQLLVAGQKLPEELNRSPFAINHVGYIKTDIELSRAYQSSDIFISPSVEDAGPMMIPEAMLCGTPVAAFDTGGAPDLIKSMETGYLAAYKDATDLAHGIYLLLTSENLPNIGQSARTAARKKHSPEIVSSQYIDLYKKLISQNERK